MLTEYEEELARIKEILRSNQKGMTVTDISRAIGVNRNSVAKYLDVLRIAGHVEMKAFGPAKVYFLSQRIPISTMLNFSSDYIIVMNSGLEITQVSDDFAYFLGMGQGDLVGHLISDVRLPLFTNEEVISKLDQALEGKDSTSEIWFETRGVDVCFRTKIIPTAFDDGGNGVTLIMENITEHKRSEMALRESEERYRTIFNSFEDLYFRTDLNGLITTVSPSVLEVTGYDPRQIKGLPLSVLFRRSADYSRFRKLMESNGEVGELEIEAVNKAGELFFATLRSRPILDESGEPEGMVGILRDVTEKKRADEMKRRAEAQLRRNIEQFTTLVEEVRNPLSVIIGYSELRGKMLMKMSEDELFGIIIDHANDIERLIQEMEDRLEESEGVQEMLESENVEDMR